MSQVIGFEMKKEHLNQCIVQECTTQRHGPFPECKEHFHIRHREGNTTYRFTPARKGFMKFKGILDCYPKLFDTSLMREEQINNGKDSKPTIKCMICKFDRWTPTISHLLNDGTKCSSCSGAFLYDLQYLLFKTQKIEWLDFSGIKETDINDGCHSRIKPTCKNCGYSWITSIRSIIQNESRCPDCCGHMAINSKERLIRRLQDKPELFEQINLDRVTDDHIHNVDSVIPAGCNKCGYEWDIIIRYLLQSTGCKRCAQKIPWNLDRVIATISVSNPKIRINRNTLNNICITTAQSMLDIECICGAQWSSSVIDFIHSRNGKCINCDPPPPRSLGMNYIISVLDLRGIKYLLEKKFEELKDIEHLRMDIFILHTPFSINIEFDGNYPGSHFKYLKNDEESKQNHIRTVRRDRIKDAFCQANNIHSLRIPFTCFPRSVTIKQIDELLWKEFIFLSNCIKPTIRYADPTPYIKRDEHLLLM